MRYRYDFHLHSCLSPCGDNDMTPYNLVNMAKVMGLDAIALTDHNTCLNCPAAVKAGKEAGVLVLPGMELCVSEEAHVVCLFGETEAALEFSRYVEGRLPEIPNRPEIFGEQRIMDGEDRITGQYDKLLLTAAEISVEEVHALVASYGGICYPAHIDRDSYSVISALGFFSETWGFPAAELTRDADEKAYRTNYPALAGLPIVRSSDAHYLEHIGCAEDEMTLKCLKWECIVEALTKKR